MSGHVQARPAARHPAVAALVLVGASLVAAATCQSPAPSMPASSLNDRDPAVANLDRDLLDALRQAASDAAEDGVAIVVTSGWRSPMHQKRLLRQAVKKYGSQVQAARWVATPGRSAHVSGDAVDVGHAAIRWLSRHGARYGLCQIYRNEPWHFEHRPRASARGCPAMYSDPTHDPRMQR